MISWYLFVTSLTFGNAQISNLFTPIIKQYKKTGLLLREDEFLGNLPIENEYDFVVIGGSPAGLVVCNRLTENTNLSVLLLEAGPEENTYSDIPAFATLMLYTEYNWHYNAEYKEGICRGMVDEKCPWPSGKGIGGATVINGLIFTRGNAEDFNRWEALGNPGWNYNETLKYFKKSEDIQIPNLKNSPFHGKGGPLTIGYTPFVSELNEKFLQAGEEIGLKRTDYNAAGSHIGVSRIQSTVRNGKRCSASKAFLKPVRFRRNLHISQRSLVIKILIDPSTKTAVGVEYIKKGKRRKVYARKEVILSAGAFDSPKLLMLSGIGHKEHLESLGIPVIQDLAVGDNLQEHVGTTALTISISEQLVPNYSREIPRLPFLLLQWQTTGQGLLTSVGCEGLAYLKSSMAKEGDRPDIELIQISASYSSDRGTNLRKNYAVRDDVYNDVYKELENKPTFSIWVMGLYPYSKGTVRLASSDPHMPPRINNGFFEDHRDIEVLIEGIRAVEKLLNTKVMKSIGAKLHKKPFKNCAGLENGSDMYWECYIREITAQFHHQCCTAKMGPREDPTAVVSPRLLVHGVNSLRVVDASIMPDIPGAHTQASAYMIGEKAADMIKEDHNLF